jgi:hypothetical protein
MLLYHRAPFSPEIKAPQAPERPRLSRLLPRRTHHHHGRYSPFGARFFSSICPMGCPSDQHLWDLKNSIVETLLLCGNRPCADSFGRHLLGALDLVAGGPRASTGAARASAWTAARRASASTGARRQKTECRDCGTGHCKHGSRKRQCRQGLQPKELVPARAPEGQEQRLRSSSMRRCQHNREKGKCKDWAQERRNRRPLEPFGLAARKFSLWALGRYRI